MYKIFDFFIESNIHIPELPEVIEGKVSITFHLSPDLSPIVNSHMNWIHHWRDTDGEVLTSFAKQSNDFYLRFPNIADFLITNKGKEIICYRNIHTGEDTVRHLLLDQVIPRVLSHQDNIILHASAVMFGISCVIFIGESGMGKSTLAASFHQNNYPIITDDCLLVKFARNKLFCTPNYSGARLWEDSYQSVVNSEVNVKYTSDYSSKRRLILHRNPEKSEVPVNTIFILDQSVHSAGPHQDKVQLEPICGANMFINLVMNSFHLDITDLEKISSQFNHYGDIVNADLKNYRLHYPRDHNMLDKVRNVIKDVVSGNVKPEYLLQ